MLSTDHPPLALELAKAGPRPVAAYLHVPFCYRRCGYCNFSLLANREDLHERFVDAILKELSSLQVPQPVETLFLGGGTPSILGQAAMERLLGGIRTWLPVHGDQEWTIEANPRDITSANLLLWRGLGIDRVSIGGQSFQDRKLQSLERDHTAQELLRAIELAASHMPRVSLDLIFAAPGETLVQWENDLRQAIGCGIGHVSTYGLTIEKGARFYGELQRKKISKVDEQIELDMYNLAIDLLGAAGIEQYEISNFARPGQECRHNQAYWNSERWWGFGPSAAGYVGTTRYVNHRATLQYLRRIESGHSPIQERDELSEDQQGRERFVFGMRQRRGVAWEEFKMSIPKPIGDELEATLDRHIGHGWIERAGTYVRLTRSGLVLSDGLWGDYLAE